MATRIVEFFKRKNGFTDKEPQHTFKDAIQEIRGFSKFAKKIKCPSCKRRQGFTLGKYERGNDGWEFTITCQHCHVSGLLNNTGFQFHQLTKGK